MALKYTFHCHVLSFIGILLFVSILHNCESKDYAPRVQTRREVSTAKECLNQNPLTSHVLDTVSGVPASNIEGTLLKWLPGSWKIIRTQTTNEDGRMGDFIDCEDFGQGIYKMVFNTKPYFTKANVTTFYPYVEIVFEVANPMSHYHIPLLLSPYGYTTYRGS